VTADGPRRAAAALQWPVGMAVAILYAAVMCLPRRIPDLARFTRSPQFAELQPLPRPGWTRIPP
jgi:hypothetical protein